MPSRKVVILGWYGNGNLGDEIILDAMLADLRTEGPALSLVAISDDPKETERLHHVRSIGSRGTARQRFRRFRELVGADLFVIGGGGILGSYGETDVASMAWLVPLRLAHELGVPTMTWGVGIGDRISPREEEAMRKVLGEADSICLRDGRSIERLDRIGVRERVTLTADPAVLFPGVISSQPLPRPESVPPKVSVFVRHWYVSENRVPDEDGWTGFKASLAACLDSLISHRSAEVSFIPMRVKDPVDDDREVAREIAGIMAQGGQAKIVDRLMPPSELVDVAARSDLVIGMRLHSLILSTTLGVPSMAINYHPKVRSYMESVGAEDWTFEIGGGMGSRLMDAAEAALNGNYPRERVLARIEEARKLAHRNTEIALGLLNDHSRDRGGTKRATLAVRALLSRALGTER